VLAATLNADLRSPPVGLCSSPPSRCAVRDTGD